MSTSHAATALVLVLGLGLAAGACSGTDDDGGTTYNCEAEQRDGATEQHERFEAELGEKEVHIRIAGGDGGAQPVSYGDRQRFAQRSIHHPQSDYREGGIAGGGHWYLVHRSLIPGQKKHIAGR